MSSCVVRGRVGKVSVRSRNESARRTRRRLNSTDAHCSAHRFKRGVSNARSRRRQRGGPGTACDGPRDESASAYLSTCRVTRVPDAKTGQRARRRAERGEEPVLGTCAVASGKTHLSGRPATLRRTPRGAADAAASMRKGASVSQFASHASVARISLAHAARFRSRGVGFARGRGPIPGSNTGYAPRDGRQGMRLVVHRSEFRASVAVAAARSGE